MKKNKILILFSLIFLIFLSSCNKEEIKKENNIKNTKITEVEKNKTPIKGEENLKEKSKKTEKIKKEIIKKEENKVKEMVEKENPKDELEFLNLLYSVQNISQYTQEEKDYVKKMEQKGEKKLFFLISKKNKKLVPLIKKEIEKKEGREKLDYIINNLETLITSKKRIGGENVKIILIKDKIKIIKDILKNNIKTDSNILDSEVKQVYSRIKEEKTKNLSGEVNIEKREELKKELEDIYLKIKNKKETILLDSLELKNGYLKNKKYKGFIVNGKKYDFFIVETYKKLKDLEKNKIDYELNKKERDGIIFFDIELSNKGINQIVNKILFSFNKKENEKILKNILTLEKNEKGNLLNINYGQISDKIRQFLNGNIYIPFELLKEENTFNEKRDKLLD